MTLLVIGTVVFLLTIPETSTHQFLKPRTWLPSFVPDGGRPLYLFETEFIHRQPRDGWMLLPAVSATYCGFVDARGRSGPTGPLSKALPRGSAV